MPKIKTKQQLLQELVEIQQELEEKVKIQDRMIKKFQELTVQEGMFAQIIDYFPYPLALCTEKGTVTMANQAWLEYTNISCKDIENGRCNLSQLSRVNNIVLSAALTKVFNGETLFLDGSQSGAAGTLTDKQEETQVNDFARAVLFPLSKYDSPITHSVVMFMN